MERETWAKEYRRLVTAYGKTSSAEQMAVYFEAMEGYSDDEIRGAVREAMTRCRFFPTVADIVARCGPVQSDESDALYPQFLKWQTVNADDPQMPTITFPMFRHYIEGQRAS